MHMNIELQYMRIANESLAIMLPRVETKTNKNNKQTEGEGVDAKKRTAALIGPGIK